MSFQGPGTGISGYSGQFSVGYTGASTNAGYAGTAGNINAYIPQIGYANQGAATAANIQSMQGMNGKAWNWSGQNGTPSHLWGGNAGSQYAVWYPNQMYMGSVGYANTAGSAANINGTAGVAGNTTHINVQGAGNQGTWAWAGQGGTPNHFWGSNDGAYHPVWQYGQMTFGNAGYANNGGYAGTVGYSNIGAQVTNAAGTVNSQGATFQDVGIGLGNILYNGLYTGYALSSYVQGTIGAVLNYKRSSGGSTGDRFLVYYNPENNTTQYGYWNGGWGNTSDFREKEQIEDLDSEVCMNFIKKLKPRKFKLKNDHKTSRLGFIAQEVLSVASNLQSESLMHIVGNCDQYLEAGATLDTENFDYEASKDVPILGVGYESFTIPLVKVVQTLMDDIKLLHIDITELESKFQ